MHAVRFEGLRAHRTDRDDDGARETVAEHRRIARELHDDLTQRLAVLAIDAGMLERLPGCPPDVGDKARGMREDLATRRVELAVDVAVISSACSGVNMTFGMRVRGRISCGLVIQRTIQAGSSLAAICRSDGPIAVTPCCLARSS